MRETLSAPWLRRSLRWLLPGGMAAIGLGHAAAAHLFFEAGGSTYDFWVEVGLFGLLGPGIIWWLLGLLISTEEQRRRAGQRLAQIEAAARAVNSSLDLEEVLRQVCSLAVAQPGIKMAWVGLIEPGSFQVKPAASAGAPSDYLQDITVTWDDSPTGQGPTGTAVRSGQPQIENDVAGDPRFAPWREAALSRGFHSSMAIPLRVKGQTLGALNLYSGEPDYFSPAVAQGFAIFADQAAVAIANARLAAENYRRVSLLDDLSARLGTELATPDILQATVNAARELLGAQYAAALLRETPGGPPVHFASAGWEAPPQLAHPGGRGLFRLILQNGQALRLGDLSEHPLAEGFPVGHPQMRGLLAVPISLRQGQVLGSLFLTEKVGMAGFAEEDEQMALALARQAAAALENARLLEEARQRAQRLEVINEVERIVGSAPVLEEVLPQVVVQLKRLITFDRVAVGMVDEAMEEITIAAVWSPIPSSLGLGVTVPLKETPSALVVRDNQPYIAADLAQERPFPTDEVLYQEGIRSYLLIPVYSRGRVIAVFGVHSCQPGQMGRQAMEVMQPLAGCLAQALDNTRMLEELRLRAQRLEVINEVGRILGATVVQEEAFPQVVEQLQRLVSFDNASIVMIDEHKKRVVVAAQWTRNPSRLTPGMVFPIEESSVSLVAEQNEPYIAHDLSTERRFATDELLFQDGIRSYLRLPLHIRGKVFATFSIASYEPDRFDEVTAEILQPLAATAAQALDNANMLEELRLRAQRLEVINEVGRILGATPMQEEVFPEVAAQLQRLVSFDAAWVVIVDEAKQELTVAAQWSQIPVPVVTRLAFPLSESSAAGVIEHNEPRIAIDLAQEHSLATDEFLFSEAGIRSYLRLPLYSRGRVFAVVTLGSQTPEHFGAEALEILQPIAITAAQALDNAIMLGELQQRSEQLEALSQRLTGHVDELEASQRRLQEAYLGILRTLNLAMESRDTYLRGHSDRDAHFARALARHMGLSEEEVRWIETAAQLHDVGKLAIPDSILLKPGPLEPAEWAVMYRHPTVAVEMLRFLDFMGPALPLIEGDHERWDGGGYPRGLRSEEIPLGARILAVTDAYDAMTSARPYRSAMNHQRACQILKEGAGTQWDPQVVEAFLAHFGEAPP